MLLILFRVSSNLIKNTLREPCGGLVLVGDSLNSSHSLILTTSGDKEFWRLVQREEEETAEESNESDSSKRQYKVSPTPIICLCAGCITFAGEVRNKSPSKHTIYGSALRQKKTVDHSYKPSNQSTNRPPCSQSTKDTTRIGRKTFQEDCCVNRQVSTDTEPQAGIKRTCTALNVS